MLSRAALAAVRASPRVSTLMSSPCAARTVTSAPSVLRTCDFGSVGCAGLDSVFTALAAARDTPVKFKGMRTYRRIRPNADVTGRLDETGPRNAKTPGLPG